MSTIAKIYVQLDEPAKASEVLKLALNNAQALQSDDSKIYALNTIAKTYAQLDEPAKASEVLKLTLSDAQAMHGGSSKSSALSTIAKTYAQLNEPAKASGVLQAAFASVQATEEDLKSYALSWIADAATQLDESAKAAELMKAILTSAQATEDDPNKSDALGGIAIAAARLDEPAKAAELLKDVLTIAQTVGGDYQNSSGVWSAMVAASWALREDQGQQSLLNKVLDVVQKGKQSSAIHQIVFLYAKQAQWNRALSALRGYGDVTTFSQLVTIHAENHNPALIAGAVVLSIAATGNPQSYTLEATLQSRNQSCNNRARWWEVITPNGNLSRWARLSLR